MYFGSITLALLSSAVEVEKAAPELATDVARARAEYGSTIADLETARRSLGEAYRSAKTDAAKAAVVDRAEALVIDALALEILPAWIGTPWSFNGTSDSPGQGTIACGMFVGTVLEHAGFRVDRIGLGRLASEHIALTLAGRRSIRRWSDRPAKEVAAEIVASGPGLYVIGLDYHAGLVLVDASGQAEFIHSSVYPPVAVAAEPLVPEDHTNPFTESRYRIAAKLFDRAMMRAWLEGTRFTLRKA